MALGLVAMAILAGLVSAEEEEKEVSQTSLAVCLMLMGTVGSTMGAFYLVNHSDPDIKTSTWRVICNTISIFAAVLLFQAVNGLVGYVFLQGTSQWIQVVVSFVHSSCWFAVLQFFLAFVSRSLRAPACLLKPLPEEDGEEKEDLLETIRLDLKCWGILIGHIAGFASINAWCVIQQFFHESLLGSALVIPGAAMSLWLIFLITNIVRERIALLGDGTKDENEVMWDESVSESEEDVRALTLSFLLVQWLRFAIFGILPSAEGDLPDLPYTSNELLTFLGVSCVIAFYNNMPGRFLCKSRLLGTGEAAKTVNMIFNLVFAWGIMYTFRTWMLTNRYLHSDASGEVLQAVVLTWATFACQHVLDYLADLESTGKETDDALRSIIATLSVLVGFSWEKCFDIAVDNIAIKVKGLIPEEVTKMGMALVLVASVLPAWRWYILPVLDRLDMLEEGGEEEGEADGYEKLEDGKEAKEKECGSYRPPNEVREVTFEDKAAPEVKSGVAEALVLKVQELQADLQKATQMQREAADSAEAAVAAKNAEADKVVALQSRVHYLEEKGSQAYQASALATVQEVETLQQQLRTALQQNDHQESRVSAALQAEQDQRTYVYQLEAERSQLQAQMGDLMAQLDNARRAQADHNQLHSRIADLQARHDTALQSQASWQAERAQLGQQLQQLQGQLEGSQAASQAQKAHHETRMRELTSQLEAVSEVQATSSTAERARIVELEELLQAQQTHSRDLESQIYADAERRAGLEALVDSLNKDAGGNPSWSRHHGAPPTLKCQEFTQERMTVPSSMSTDVAANDDLVRTLAGVPVQPGSSVGGASAISAISAEGSSLQAVPREPISVQSAGQRLMSPNGVLAPNAGTPPQLLTNRSQPSSPDARPKSGQASGPSSPILARQPPVSPPSSGSNSRHAAKAPNRKPPALQPGQAPAAPRLSSSDPQLRNRTEPVAQRMVVPSSSRGSSSKEAVFPNIASVQQSRLLNTRR